MYDDPIHALMATIAKVMKKNSSAGPSDTQKEWPYASSTPSFSAPTKTAPTKAPTLMSIPCLAKYRVVAPMVPVRMGTVELTSRATGIQAETVPRSQTKIDAPAPSLDGAQGLVGGMLLWFSPTVRTCHDMGGMKCALATSVGLFYWASQGALQPTTTTLTIPSTDKSNLIAIITSATSWQFPSDTLLTLISPVSSPRMVRKLAKRLCNACGREAGASEDEREFDENLRKIAKPRPTDIVPAKDEK